MSKVDLQKILAKHQARAQKKAQQAQTRAESSAKFKREQAETRRKNRDAELRKRRNKSGMAIAEQFVELVAPHFLRTVRRDDAAKLKDIRVEFRFSKTDQGPYSAVIRSGLSQKDGGTRNYPSGSISNAASKHGCDDEEGWLLKRLREKLGRTDGKNRYASMAEALEEILMLRQQLAAAEARIRSLQPESETTSEAEESDNTPDDVPATSDEDNPIDSFDVQLPEAAEPEAAQTEKPDDDEATEVLDANAFEEIEVASDVPVTLED